MRNSGKDGVTCEDNGEDEVDPLELLVQGGALFRVNVGLYRRQCEVADDEQPHKPLQALHDDETKNNLSRGLSTDSTMSLA